MLSLTFGEQVKIVLSRKNMTIKELAEEIEMKTGKKMSRQNLTQRLGRDNFQEQDMRMIAEILGCPFQLNILSDEDRHGNVSEDIYSAESSEERKEKKKKGKTIFLEPQTDLFQRMDELSSSERDITIGELVDIHEQLEQMEQEKRVDASGESSVLKYEVPGEEEKTADGAQNAAEVTEEPEAEVQAETDTGKAEAETSEESDPQGEEPPEISSEEPKEDSEIPAETAEDVVSETEEDRKEEMTGKEEPEETVEDKKEEPEETPEPQSIQPEPKPVKKRNPFSSVLKGYIRKASKSRDTREPEKAEEPEKEEAAVDEVKAVSEPTEEPKVTEETENAEEEMSAGEKEEPEKEPEAKVEHERRRGPQMMPDGIGEVNPYTGKEYETNSVRMHPNRIGYIQVYDRGEHQWADMTEWAFLGYQERKKALLGDQYEPPIYLD